MYRVSCSIKTIGDIQMLIQINSGVGPKECERACYLYCKELMKELPDLKIIEMKQTDKGCCQSILLYGEEDLSYLQGTVQWICESPFRKHHKRKNWFIDISVFEEEQLIGNTDDISYEVVHSRGKGGQNINKVATAVRATHLPTGISVIAMDQRSQLQNKKLATLRLIEKLESDVSKVNHMIQYQNWNRHNLIVRGQPYRVYKGENFKLITKER